MSGRFEQLRAACVALGFHGICPEALTKLEEIERERKEFMHGMRRMFFSEDEAQRIEERNGE